MTARTAHPIPPESIRQRVDLVLEVDLVNRDPEGVVRDEAVVYPLAPSPFLILRDHFTAETDRRLGRWFLRYYGEVVHARILAPEPGRYVVVARWTPDEEWRELAPEDQEEEPAG